MRFIKENWFKLVVAVFLLITALSGLYYFIYIPHKEKINLSVCFENIVNKNSGKNLDNESINSIINYCNSNKAKEWTETEDTCNFSFIDVKNSRYDFCPDLNEIQRKEEYCEKNKGGAFGNLFCSRDDIEKLKNKCDTYIEIEGLIKNNSDEAQDLSSMISKIYTDDDKGVLLGEGYKNIKQKIAPEVSLPFKISVHINRNNESIKNYFKDGENLRYDTYPWFTTCK